MRPVGEELLHQLTRFMIQDVTLGSEQLRGFQPHDLMTQLYSFAPLRHVQLTGEGTRPIKGPSAGVLKDKNRSSRKYRE